MMLDTRFTRALALAAGLGVAADAMAQPAAPQPPAAKAAKPATKPAAKSMSFTAVVGYESPSKLGPPIVYSTRYDVTMQRPDKLRIIVPGDGPATEFYYDGKTVIAYAPAENLAAIADAPPTIEATLERAFQNAQIFFPFEDLIVTDPYAALTKGAILAFYIGPYSNVGGVKTDMVAWANDDVFLQIWIGSDDKLPRRIRAMYRADPLALQHEMLLSDWKLDPALSADTFTTVKAQSAGRMSFAAPGPPPLPKGVKPLGMKAKPANAPAKPK